MAPAGEPLVGAGNSSYLTAMSTEEPNLRVCLDSIYSGNGMDKSSHTSIAAELLNFYNYTGQFGVGVNLALSAIEFAHKIENKLGEANCIKRLGDIHLRLSAFKEAAQAYESAIPLFKEVQNKLGEANCIKRLGEVDLHSGDAASAMKKFSEAYNLFELVQDFTGMAICTVRRAQVISATEEATDKISELFERAIALFERAAQPANMAHSFVDYGRFLISRKEKEKARQVLEQAVNIYEQIGDLVQAGTVKDMLSSL